jgi:peroxiredoxin
MSDPIRRRVSAVMGALCTAVVLTLSSAGTAHAALAQVGQPAPNFSLGSIEGKKVSLADFAGRFVVLEWWNSDCYAINRHYDTGNMQAAQRKAREADVVWLSIDSTHPAHPSFVDAKRTADMLRKWKGAQTAMLQDPEGKVGRLFGARMTPHTYVIDPKGRLIYAGAIDDQRSMRDFSKARNLALAAIEDSRAGRPVAQPVTQAYG